MLLHICINHYFFTKNDFYLQFEIARVNAPLVRTREACRLLIDSLDWPNQEFSTINENGSK
jgi:hypothetical protein